MSTRPRPALTRRPWILLPLLALSLVACQRDPTGRDGSLRASEFVEIVVQLRTAERELEREVDRTIPADSLPEAFAQRRAEILARHGATEDDLRDFVERHHMRPGLMAAVWDSIANRLRVQPDDRAEPTESIQSPDEIW